ncbi:MAG: bifunctional UDP-N-acetylglucosamine diphosphorylase/glucosamine-1-phosphate N-acetyltransferase GlmU [Firmicutes bacterium]|nr:bifunctional UDP-N-acetylglucosamine diphosphorylase/glucosamine-1-phosphate N-acetyltransferase GlmU [Bacillota bacterium]
MYCALILAEDEPNKMHSEVPIALHEICFKSIINWVLNTADGAAEKVIVSNFENIKENICDSVKFVYANKKEDICKAVLQLKELLYQYDDILITTDKFPLITDSTLKTAFTYHTSSKNDATILSCASEQGSWGCETLNAGVGFIKTKLLISALGEASNQPQAKHSFEGIIKGFEKGKQKIGKYKINDINELLGINDREQLLTANEVMQRRINKHFMQKGVTLISSNTAYISGDAVIGHDTIVMPNTIIEGNTKIGSNCIIGPNSRLVNATIDNGTTVNNSVVVSSRVGANTNIGPFSYIRPGCDIGDNVKIGDFVEVKNSVVKDGTHAAHLTYIGDADVGSKVNFGCGTIVVNYDGKKKHRTKIGNNAFIGCNTNLISPLNVGDDTFIAAGSTITQDMPDGSFAIARSRQITKTDWKRK